MVEKIIINPEKVRGLGDIVSPKADTDFEGYNATISAGTDTVNGVSTTVYGINYVSSNINVALAVSSDSVIVGASVTLTATVTDDEDAPIEGATVTFKVDGSTIDTGTTNSSGVATQSYTCDTVETLHFIATVEYTNSPSAVVIVNKHNTTITCAVNPLTAVGSGDFVITATVVDEASNPVVNEYVTFYAYYGGSSHFLGTHRTDSNGVATHTYSLSSVGQQDIFTSFPVTDNYNYSTSNQVTIEVLSHSYSLAFSESSYVATGGSATLSVTLLDNGVAVSGATVTVTGSDSSSYTCTTNSNGVGTVTVTGVTAETTFTASYSGATTTCTVTVQSYLFYDDCTSDRSSDYTAITGTGWKTLSTFAYDSTNQCYNLKTQTSGSEGTYGLLVNNVTCGNVKITGKVQVNTTGNAQIGFGLHNKSDTTVQITSRLVKDNNTISIIRVSPDTSLANSSQTLNTNTWYGIEFTRENNNVSFKLYSSSGTLLKTLTGTTSALSTSNNQPFVYFGYQNNMQAKFKELKVEAL